MKKDIIDQLLRLQFQAIGETYSPEFCKQPNWFQLKSWTPQQRCEFKERFMKLMKKNGLPRHALDSEWMWWDLAYGWTDSQPFTRDTHEINRV